MRWKLLKNVTFAGSNIANNTESSSERIDHFGNTDHSRLSAIGGELTDDESSVSSRSSKPTQLAGCQTPRFRTNSSPDLNRNKPDMVPKLPHLADAEVQTGWLLMVWSYFILCLPQWSASMWWVFHDTLSILHCSATTWWLGNQQKCSQWCPNKRWERALEPRQPVLADSTEILQSENRQVFFWWPLLLQITRSSSPRCQVRRSVGSSGLVMHRYSLMWLPDGPQKKKDDWLMWFRPAGLISHVKTFWPTLVSRMFWIQN